MALFDIFKIRKCGKLVTPIWQLLWQAKPEKPADNCPDTGQQHLIFIGSLFYLTYIRSAQAVGMDREISRTLALDKMKEAKFDVETIDGVVALYPMSGEETHKHAVALDLWLSEIITTSFTGGKLPEVEVIRERLYSIYMQRQ